MNLASILMWGMPSGIELIVIAAIALLIFGRRLPDVARSLGKSIVEFKRGIRDVKDDIEVESKNDSQPKIENKANARDQISSQEHADT